jgi:hypothetical protein
MAFVFLGPSGMPARKAVYAASTVGAWPGTRTTSTPRTVAATAASTEVGPERRIETANGSYPPSTATTAKHLENIYEKLGVHSRTAAVAPLNGET